MLVELEADLLALGDPVEPLDVWVPVVSEAPDDCAVAVSLPVAVGDPEEPVAVLLPPPVEVLFPTPKSQPPQAQKITATDKFEGWGRGVSTAELVAEGSCCLEICSSAIGEQTICNLLHARGTETSNVVGEVGTSLGSAVGDTRVRRLGTHKGRNDSNNGQSEEFHGCLNEDEQDMLHRQRERASVNE